MRHEASPLRTADIPQADSLAAIRTVVEVLAQAGAEIAEIGAIAGVSERHVRYRLAAARILGFLDENQRITVRGWRLLSCPANTPAEKQVLVQAVTGAEVVQRVAPQLLVGEFNLAEVAESIAQQSALSPATAERRARVLWAWKRQLG